MKILYYTSTGNNLFIAKQLGGELLSIPQLVKDNIYEIKDDSVGIVFPVFFATSPKTLREFVKKVNICADYIFLICSYGSDGDYHALKIMKKTFNKRGININYTNSVLMVDNFLPVFDMAHEMEIKNDSDIVADDGCSSCRICTKVCPRGNIEVIDGKPQFGEACDFCLSCVHHCKTHTLSINDEANPNERYINPNVKLSEIIKSNNLYQ